MKNNECFFCKQDTTAYFLFEDSAVCCLNESCKNNLVSLYKSRGASDDLQATLSFILHYVGYTINKTVPWLIIDQGFVNIYWDNDYVGLQCLKDKFYLEFGEDEHGVSWSLSEPDSLDKDLIKLINELNDKRRKMRKFQEAAVKKVQKLYKTLNDQAIEKFGMKLFPGVALLEDAIIEDMEREFLEEYFEVEAERQ